MCGFIKILFFGHHKNNNRIPQKQEPKSKLRSFKGHYTHSHRRTHVLAVGRPFAWRLPEPGTSVFV